MAINTGNQKITRMVQITQNLEILFLKEVLKKVKLEDKMIKILYVKEDQQEK